MRYKLYNFNKVDFVKNFRVRKFMPNPLKIVFIYLFSKTTLVSSAYRIENNSLNNFEKLLFLY